MKKQFRARIWNEKKIIGIEKSFCLKKIKQKNIILPLMIWELLRYKLLKKDDESKGFFGYFFHYLDGKYKDLWTWNYKNIIENYSGKNEINKQKIKEILDIFNWK